MTTQKKLQKTKTIFILAMVLFAGLQGCQNDPFKKERKIETREFENINSLTDYLFKNMKDMKEGVNATIEKDKESDRFIIKIEK